MPSQVLVSAGHARDPQKGLRSKDVLRLVTHGACAAALVVAVGVRPPSASAQGAAGTIKGRITFTGKEPGNKVIRMGMDPMCVSANAGKRTVNEVYLVGDNNTL